MDQCIFRRRERHPQVELCRSSDGFVRARPDVCPLLHLLLVDFHLGKDIKEKINFLLDCANEEEPALLKAIAQDLPLQPPHHKFNSLDIYSKKPEDVSNCLEYFQKFLNYLAATTSKIVTFPKQMLGEMKRLEAVVYGLQDRAKLEVGLLKEIRKVRELSEFHVGNVELEVERNSLRRVSLAFGEYVTNCTECKMTCHLVCGIKGDKVDCDVMDHSMPQESRTCRVCPGGYCGRCIAASRPDGKTAPKRRACRCC